MQRTQGPGHSSLYGPQIMSAKRPTPTMTASATVACQRPSRVGERASVSRRTRSLDRSAGQTCQPSSRTRRQPRRRIDVKPRTLPASHEHLAVDQRRSCCRRVFSKISRDYDSVRRRKTDGCKSQTISVPQTRQAALRNKHNTRFEGTRLRRTSQRKPPLVELSHKTCLQRCCCNLVTTRFNVYRSPVHAHDVSLQQSLCVCGSGE